MADGAKALNLVRGTVKARGKKRFTVVTDENFINLMKAVGKPIEAVSRAVDSKQGQTLVGIFILPTNNVIEIYKDKSDLEKAVLFNNIDVWISFSLSDLEN